MDYNNVKMPMNAHEDLLLHQNEGYALLKCVSCHVQMSVRETFSNCKSLKEDINKGTLILHLL